MPNPRTGGTSNLDPLEIFNTPSPVPQRGGGAGIQAGGGLFDNFVPRPGGNGVMPTGNGVTTPDFSTMYSMPTEVGGRNGTSVSAPTGFQPRQIVQQPQQPNLLSTYGPQLGQIPMNPLGGNLAPPITNFTNTTPPQFQMPQMGGGATDSAAGQWLANLMATGNQYLTNFAQNGQPVQLQNPFLQSIAQNGLPTSLNNSYLQQWAQNGQPVDVQPMWNEYINSMQRNIQGNQANLMEMFNQSGGYNSTSFGNAAVDYMTQTAKDQNALLAQYGYQSQADALNRQFQAGGTYDALKAQLSEAAAGRQLQAGSLLDQLQFQGLSDAMNRQYGAASQLGQQAFGAGQSLTNYDFQSQMAQYQAGLQAAMMASQQAGGLQGSALSQLGGYGSTAANQLLQNALGGVSGLFGGSQNALNNMFNASSSVPGSLLQAFLTQNGQNMQGNSALMNAYLQNLGLGSQMGGQQYNTLQSQLGSLYQEWLRTQSQYNPLLPYMFQGATGYVPTSQTSSPGFWDYFTQILGSGIGAAGSVLGKVLSDERTKENIMPVGQLYDVPIYEYEYVGFPGKHVGVLAQEIVKTHPGVVYTDESGTMSVDYGKLAQELMLSGGVN